jgi:hypothetical protein
LPSACTPRRRPESKHIARMLLIGFYTGTRPGTILKLKWLQSTDGGHIDLNAGILHRRPVGAKKSKKKRAPRCRDPRQAAGAGSLLEGGRLGQIGMSPATLEAVYGHHSPSFQNRAAGYTPAVSNKKRQPADGHRGPFPRAGSARAKAQARLGARRRAWTSRKGPPRSFATTIS